jgi:hypothetical protein
VTFTEFDLEELAVMYAWPASTVRRMPGGVWNVVLVPGLTVALVE